MTMRSAFAFSPESSSFVFRNERTTERPGDHLDQSPRKKEGTIGRYYPNHDAASRKCSKACRLTSDVDVMARAGPVDPWPSFPGDG